MDEHSFFFFMCRQFFFIIALHWNKFGGEFVIFLPDRFRLILLRLRIFTRTIHLSLGVLMFFNSWCHVYEIFNPLLMNLSTRRVRYRFVICLFFRHISSYVMLQFLTIDTLRVSSPPPDSKLLVKFVGRILTRGVLNLYLLLPTSRVFSLLCRTRHSFWKIHCTWLSYIGVESGVDVLSCGLASPTW